MTAGQAKPLLLSGRQFSAYSFVVAFRLQCIHSHDVVSRHWVSSTSMQLKTIDDIRKWVDQDFHLHGEQSWGEGALEKRATEMRKGVHRWSVCRSSGPSIIYTGWILVSWAADLHALSWSLCSNVVVLNSDFNDLTFFSVLSCIHVFYQFCDFCPADRSLDIV